MSIGLEPYLDYIKNRKLRFELASFRIGSHGLEVDVGRRRNQAREERLCRMCNMDVVEDEMHFLLYCPAYNDIRENILPRKYFVYPNNYKFNILMSMQNESVSITLAKFLYLAKERRNMYLKL